MKELKILATLIVFVGITYYGIEPYAHHIMHPEPIEADFNFDGKQDVELTEDKAKKQELSAFYESSLTIAAISGDAQAGKALVEANCIACHAVEKAGYPAMMPDADSAAAYGVVPPDLSNAGYLYSANYLASFIRKPVVAMNIAHKYGASSGKVFPMPDFDWMQPKEIADMIAYFKQLAPKELSDEEVFDNACSRCHDMQYDGVKAKTPTAIASNYLGSTPPDLSMYIRSRGEHYLHSFINNPQVLLPGTAMPRVGLNEKAQEQVIAYMESVGDRKKDERNALGIWVIGFFIILSVLAYLWKQEIFKEYH